MPAATLALSDQDRRRLESWTRSSTISAGQRERAQIVLAVADGAGVSGAARALGVSRPTVIKWRDRFAADGVDGLDDLPRSGRPKTIDDAQIIAATLEAPPASLAVTHWSSRLLGKHLGIGDATVARAWRAPPGAVRPRGRGGRTACGRGGAGPSNFPPTLNWRAKSAMSSVSIWTRPSTRSCSA